MQNIPTILIRTFIMMAKIKNTVECSNIMNRSQPAISLQIKRLEELLNCKLFERNIKSMSLTKEGETLYPLAEKMIEANDLIIENMLITNPYKTIRMGMPNDIALVMWNKLITNFKQDNKNITIDITENFSEKIISDFNNKELDLAIVATSDKIRHKNAIFTTSRPIIWVANKNVNLDSKDIELITAPSGCAYREIMLETLKQEEKNISFSVISKSTSATKSSVESGEGVTACLNSVKEHIFNSEIVHSPKEIELEKINLSILYNKERNKPLVDKFIKQLIPILEKI